MNLAIIGGRLFSNDEHMGAVLDFLHGTTPISGLSADAKFGAGRIALEWAKTKHIPSVAVRPDLVLAFRTSPRVEGLVRDCLGLGLKVLDGKTGAELK